MCLWCSMREKHWYVKANRCKKTGTLWKESKWAKHFGVAPEGGWGVSLGLSGGAAGSRAARPGPPRRWCCWTGEAAQPWPRSIFQCGPPCFPFVLHVILRGPRFLLGEEGVSVLPGAYPGLVCDAAPRQTSLRPPWRWRWSLKAMFFPWTAWLARW